MPKIYFSFILISVFTLPGWGLETPSGDLLVGRENQLSATSTCGLTAPSTYCVPPNFGASGDDGCFTCDSQVPYTEFDKNTTHLVENVVNSDQHFLRKSYWWQSETGQSNVSIQLDLESHFELDSVTIVFKFSNPHSMAIRKSNDFGKTWTTLQYYSYDCTRVFPGVPTLFSRNPGDVFCDNTFSNPIFEKDSTVQFVLTDVIGEPNSEKAQDMKIVTNIQIQLLKMHNTYANQYSDFYSISQLEIGGNCFCNGHASKCIPKDPYESFVRDKIYGVCQCDHFTEGTNCERCMPMYNALPWQPWSSEEQFQCKECECNNHATTCRFNQTQFDLSGDGGQCVNCDDQTDGPHCDRCRTGYHLQLGRLISDRYPCRMCAYDQRGVTAEICDPQTGQVFCKSKVTGVRCDTCVEGYFGLSYGSSDGCQRCNCRAGGSRSQICDSKSGKCQCRSGFQGQKCGELFVGYFVPGFDYLLLDAENSQSDLRKIVQKDDTTDKLAKTWTGSGFVELSQGDSVTLALNRDKTLLPKTSRPIIFTPYLRLRPLGENTNSVNLTVQFMLAGEDSDTRSMISKWQSVCREVNVDNPMKSFSQIITSSNTAWGWVKLGRDETELCIQSDLPVVMVIQLQQDKTTIYESLFLDSVVLVPRPDMSSISQFGISPDDVLDSYCIEQQMSLQSGVHFISEKCYTYTVGVQGDLYDGALSCNCDVQGSLTFFSICQPIGGLCPCKRNVIGRNCGQCALGSFNISNENGCQDCFCDMLGTKPGTFCDSVTGNCDCLPGFYGKNCDQCEPGRYAFPKCESCDCNGKAAECDPKSGKCLDCNGHSSGFNCEICEDGYYLDTQSGDGTCRACSCPGTFQDSFNKSISFFASSCKMEPLGNVVCSCKPGYKGDLCTECAAGFFGNPAAGVECEPCDCHGNEKDRVTKCDSRTGTCLGCRGNAAGDKCEVCAEGFHGDPTDDSIGCSACSCNPLGTLSKTCGPSGCSCDQNSGRCFCKPNVIGADCSQCAQGHFNLTHPEGCQPCECSSYGSLGNTCDPETGVCECLPYYGGRSCDQCINGEWGNPLIKCEPCDCNLWGSESSQCSRYNGQCTCRAGVKGQKCDQCEDGYQGTFPACEPCGPCYDNWKMILDKLKMEADDLTEKAAKIEKSGNVGEYKTEFEKLESYIKEIEDLLEINKEAADRLKQLKDTIETSKIRVRQLEDELSLLVKSIESQDIDVDSLKRQLDAINKAINASTFRINVLRSKKDSIAADSLIGIKERISIATERSKKALYDSLEEMEKLMGIESQLDYIEQQLKSIDPAQYEETVEKFSKTFEELEDRVTATQEYVNNMTKLMCGGKPAGDCEVCGGPRCSFCGNMPTEEGIVLATCKGATTYSRKADSKLKAIIDLLDRKLQRAKEVLQEVNKALSLVEITSISSADLRRTAVEAKDAASKLNKTFSDQLTAISAQKTLSYQYLDDVSHLLKAIDGFQMPNITQQDITNLEKEMRSMENQVGKMAQATSEMQANVSLVRSLLQDAITSRKVAESVLNDIMRLVNLLNDAMKSNNLTEGAIKDTQRILDQMEGKITDLRIDMASLDKVVNETADLLRGVLLCRDTLVSLMSSLNVELTDAESVAKQANASVNNSKSEADQLRNDYDGLENVLEQKMNETAEVMKKAEEAENEANSLTTGAAEIFDRFQKLNRKLESQMNKLKGYQQKIDSLNGRLEDAWEKIRYQYQLKYNPKCTQINFPK